MITEEIIIKNIKNKKENELTNYFDDNNIKSENYENFKGILHYLINNNEDIEIIQFIIDRQKNKDNVESLFQAIQQNNFKIAKLLLKNHANINGTIKLDNNQYYNIIEYLLDFNYLDLQNLKFILKNGVSGKLINSKLICNLIKDERNDILKRILQYNYFSNEFLEATILREFLIKIYKNKKSLSTKQINQLLSNDELTFRIDINEKESYDNYPLLQAINYNNLENVELLMRYADDHEFILSINDKDHDEYFPLLQSIRTNQWGNIDILKMLLNYSNRHKLTLNINEKDLRGNFPLLQAIFNNNIEIIHLLIDYANQHEILLNINEKDYHGNYPLLQALDTVDGVALNIVDILINYGKEHKIILNLNEKNNDGNYPLLQSSYKNSYHSVKQLMKYAKKQGIILILNDIDNEGYYPLYFAVKHKNSKLIKLLFKYAKYYGIELTKDVKLNNEEDRQLLSSIDI